VVLSAPIKTDVTTDAVVSDASHATIPSSCARSVTPACLQAQYGIPTTPATQSTNAIGVSGYDDQYANKADLTSFLKKYRTDMSSATTFTLQTLDGGSNSQTLRNAGVEAVSAFLMTDACAIDTCLCQDLDIQYTVGLATNVPTYFISGKSHLILISLYHRLTSVLVGEQNQDGDLDGFLDTVNFLLGESAPPQVLTTSYGPNEGDVSRALTK
jgi:tripeptidyl-peptidase-1